MKKILPVVLVFLFLYLLPSLISPEPYRSEQLRKLNNIQTINLTHGAVHYEDRGESDTAVLLLSGYSVPMFIWDKQFDSLVSWGWRTIRYNYYGRGFSEYPSVEYDRELLVNQSLELLDSLQVEKVILIGHSMGGALAAEIANQRPNLIVSTILLDPMLDKITNNSGATIARIPLLGSWLNRLLVIPGLTKRAMALFDDAGIPAVSRYRDEFNLQKKSDGFSRAVFRSFRSDMLENYETSYREFGEKKIPTLILCANPEEMTPEGNMECIVNALPEALTIQFPDAGHVVHFTHPEIINRAIRSFIEPIPSDSLQNIPALPIGTSMGLEF